jgi:hypothetical protein
MKLIIGGIILVFVFVLYFFAKDLVITTLGKARNGLAIIGGGTVVYWIYSFVLKE